MKTLVKALRLHVTLLAALLAIAGYTVSHLPIHWSIIGLTFLISIGAMMTNDYIDRVNDNLKKQKNYAYDNAKTMRIYLYFFWFAVLLLVTFILNTWNLQLLLMIAMIVLSIGYSYSRRYVFLPTLLVAITCSIPPLFAFAEGGSIKCIVLSFSVFCIMCAREMLMDMKEVNEDRGYKKALFTEGKIIDPKKAMRIIAALMLAGSLASLTLFFPVIYNLPYLPYLLGFCLLVGASCLAWTAMHSIDDVKGMLDKGMALILIAIVLLKFF